MNNRDWFCLALRLFGIWLLISAIEMIPYLFSALFSNYLEEILDSFLSTALWGFGRAAIGLILLLFAPAISARLYPDAVADEKSTDASKINPLKVGIQLLGIYALLMALQSIDVVVMGFMSARTYDILTSGDYYQSTYFFSLMTCGLNLAFGAVLIIWNERVVALIEKFRYVPERDAYERPGSEEE